MYRRARLWGWLALGFLAACFLCGFVGGDDLAAAVIPWLFYAGVIANALCVFLGCGAVLQGTEHAERLALVAISFWGVLLFVCVAATRIDGWPPFRDRAGARLTGAGET